MLVYRHVEIKNRLDRHSWALRVCSAIPPMLIGLACGGGVLAASILTGGRGSSSGRRVRDSDTTFGDRPHSRANDAWDGIKGALIGVAASRLTEFVEGVLPGFKQHFESAQDGKAQSWSSQRAGRA